MPYDRFATEQLAGDLLPNATLDQRIATGFIRCGVTTNEAGIIEDEYAEIYAKDRAETVSAVFIGPDHRLRHLPRPQIRSHRQKDFYALGAFFRNTTQRVMDDNRPIHRLSWSCRGPRIAKRGRRPMRGSRRFARAWRGRAARSDCAFEKWLDAARRTTIVKSPLEDEAELLRLISPLWRRAVRTFSSAIRMSPAAGCSFEAEPKRRRSRASPSKDAAETGCRKAVLHQRRLLLSQSRTRLYDRRAQTIRKRRIAAGRSTSAVACRHSGIVGRRRPTIEIRAAHLRSCSRARGIRIAVSYDGSRQSIRPEYVSERPRRPDAGPRQSEYGLRRRYRRRRRRWFWAARFPDGAICRFPHLRSRGQRKLRRACSASGPPFRRRWHGFHRTHHRPRTPLLTYFLSASTNLTASSPRNRTN